MQQQLSTYLFLTLIVLMAVACKRTDPLAHDRVMLMAQESAQLASGITVFVDAIADYRCPPGGNCAVGGTASVSLRLQKGAELPAFRLSLGVRNQHYQGQLFTDSVGVVFEEQRYKVILCDVARSSMYAVPQAVIQVSRQ